MKKVFIKVNGEKYWKDIGEDVNEIPVEQYPLHLIDKYITKKR